MQISFIKETFIIAQKITKDVKIKGTECQNRHPRILEVEGGNSTGYASRSLCPQYNISVTLYQTHAENYSSCHSQTVNRWIQTSRRPYNAFVQVYKCGGRHVSVRRNVLKYSFRGLSMSFSVVSVVHLKRHTHQYTS